MKNLVVNYLVVLLFFFALVPICSASQEYEELTITTDFGSYSASYFQAASTEGAIFIPGAKFDKEGWHSVAIQLKQQNIHAISFDEIAGPAIIEAMNFLQSKGVKQVALIGGSRGAGVALTIPIHPLINPELSTTISKMVLLAPFGGDGPQRNDIKKLFIIGENDGLSYSNTMRVFSESSEPKALEIIPATAYHAQQLLQTRDKELVENMIIEFITH